MSCIFFCLLENIFKIFLKCLMWPMCCLKLYYLISAAAAAKSLQSCLTLCDPIDSSPPGSSVPGNLQARTLEWVAVSFSNALKWKVKVKSLSRVWLLATPWTAAYQAPPSMGFSRQEYWSGLPLPSLIWPLFGIIPDIFILLIASLIFLWSEIIPLYDFCSLKFKMCFMTWNMVSLGKCSVSLSRIFILLLLEEVVYKYQLHPVGWWCFSVNFLPSESVNYW